MVLSAEERSEDPYPSHAVQLNGNRFFFLRRLDLGWQLYARFEGSYEDCLCSSIYDLRALRRARFTPELLDAAFDRTRSAEDQGLIQRLGYLYFADGGFTGVHYRSADTEERFYESYLPTLGGPFSGGYQILLAQVIVDLRRSSGGATARFAPWVSFMRRAGA